MLSNYSSAESEDRSPQGPAQMERLAAVASIGDDDDEVEEPSTTEKRSVFRLEEIASNPR